MNDLFRSQFRLPNELADKLRESAEKSNRSLNAELVARLERSFSDVPAVNGVSMMELFSKLEELETMIKAGALSGTSNK